MPKSPNLFTYYVSGRGTFPFDMLRYDQAWPASEGEAGQFTRPRLQTPNGEWWIQLTGLRSPTIERWRSFGWEVLAARETRRAQ